MSESGYESLAVWSVVASSVLFALALVLIFNKYLAPAVAATQAARNEEIAAAEARRDQAKADLAAAHLEGRKLEDAMADMRIRAQADAQREREQILAEAKAEGDRVVRNAEGELERARGAAQARIRQTLLVRAIERAHERAAAEIDRTRDARIVGAFTERLGTTARSLATAGEAN